MSGRKTVDNQLSSKDIDVKSLVDSSKTAKEQKNASKEIVKVHEDMADDIINIQRKSADKSVTYHTELLKAGVDTLKNSSEKIVSSFSSQARDVLGSGLSGVWDLGKDVGKSLYGGFKKFKEIKEKKDSEKSEKFLEGINNSQKEFNKHALKKGSIYTHDVTVEKIIMDINKLSEQQTVKAENTEKILFDTKNIMSDIKRLYQKSMDLLFDREKEGKEEQVTLDIPTLLNDILKVNTAMAKDLFTMREASAQNLGILKNLFMPVTELWRLYFRSSAGDTKRVENRLIEVRNMLSKIYNFSTDDVKVKDKKWRWYFTMLPKSVMGLFSLPKFFKGMIRGQEEQLRVLSTADETNYILFDILKSVEKIGDGIVASAQGMDEYFKMKQKQDARTVVKKDKFPWMDILIVAGLLLGAYLRKIVIQLQAFYLGLKGMVTGFTKIPIIANIISKVGIVGKFFASVSKLFGWIGKTAGNVFRLLTRIPIVGKFFSAMLKGFRLFGWPLTIILSAIDFIKGFVTTEGNLIDKIKGGLMSVVKGFIELPVKLIGWVADWVLGLFGVQKPEGGSAKLIMDGIMRVVSIGIDIIMAVPRTIYEFFSAILNRSEDTSIFEAIMNFISELPKRLGVWILENIPGAKWAYTQIQDLLGVSEGESILDATIKWFKNLSSAIGSWILENVPGAKWVYAQITDILGVSEPSFLDTLFAWFKNLSSAIGSWILENVPGAKWVVNFAGDVLSYLGVGENVGIIDHMMDWFKNLSSTIFNWIYENVPGAKWLIEKGQDLISYLGSMSVENTILDRIIDFVTNLPSAVTEYLKSTTVGKWAMKGLSWFSKNKDDIGEKTKDIAKKTVELGKKGIEGAKDLGKETYEKGKEMFSSIDTDLLKAKAEEFGNNVLGFMSDKFNLLGEAVNSMSIKFNDLSKTIDLLIESINKNIATGYHKTVELGKKGIEGAKDLGVKAVDGAKEIGAKAYVGAKDLSSSAIGYLSAKYESSGKGAGTISTGKGDKGGVSYGTHQLKSEGGLKSTVAQFINTSKWKDMFAGLMPGTKEFSERWKETAEKFKGEFGEAQHAFMTKTHFDPIIKGLGLSKDQMGAGLTETLFSLGTQHGAGGARNLLSKALGNADLSKMSQEDIINAIYAERGKRTKTGELAYFKSSSKEVQESVANRLRRERLDALGIAKKSPARVEMAMSDVNKAEKEAYEKREAEKAKDNMRADDMNRHLAANTLNTGKIKDEVATSNNISNIMAVAGGGGGGRGSGINAGSGPIPEMDNILLSLGLAGLSA
jgi:hypothetical protein